MIIIILLKFKLLVKIKRKNSLCNKGKFKFFIFEINVLFFKISKKIN